MLKFRAACAIQALSGFGVTPATQTRRVPTSVRDKPLECV